MKNFSVKIFLTFMFVGIYNLIPAQIFSYSTLSKPDSIEFMINNYMGIQYWDYGDGKLDTTNNVPDRTHKYAQPGLYNVCAYEDYMGVKTSQCITIEIQSTTDYNTAAIKPENLQNPFWESVLNDSTRKFNNNLLNDPAKVSYFWDFGDGSTSQLHSPVHVFKTKGKYNVTLTVRDKLNGKSYSITKQFVIGNWGCSADFSYIVRGDTVKFTGNLTGGLTHAYWWFGDGTYAVNVTNPVHIYKTPGEYTVGLVGIDNVTNYSCFDYSLSTVRVGNLKCNASFNYYVDSVNKDVYFRSTSIGNPTKFNWVFGDGTVSYKENPVHRFSKPGIYSVTLSVQNLLGNCMDAAKKYITVGNISKDLAPDFIHHTDTITHTVAFYNKTIGKADKFIWSFGDGKTLTVRDTTYTYLKGGYYRVCLTAIKDTMRITNCKTIQAGADYNQKCKADFIYTVDSGAITKVYFVNKSIGVGTLSYSWDFGNGSISNLKNPDISYTTPGYYRVGLKVKDGYDCESRSYALIKIKNAPSGIHVCFKADSGDIDRTKASGYPVDFVSIAHGDAAKLKWTFGDGTIDTLSENPTHLFFPENYTPRRDTFTVCIEVTDPITNDYNKYCELVNLKLLNNISETTSFPAVLNIYPNPFTNFAIIEYLLDVPEKVDLTVLKPDGTIVQKLFSGLRPAGKYSMVLEGAKLQSGMYFVQLQTDNGNIIRKILLIK